MFKKSLLAIFLIIWVILAIDPVDPGIWALENILIVTLLPVLLWLDRNYNFNNWTFFSLTLFAVLHLFGANLTYNTMTHFTWFSDLFGWQRNYYDQVIHFLFGLMMVIPFYEIFYHQGYSKRLSYLIAFLFISSIGSWYEVLEWITVITFCKQPEQVCLAAITQNDVWDAQKDMAYAVIGSVVTILVHNQFVKPTRPPLAKTRVNNKNV